jgi:hypothetical protein
MTIGNGDAYDWVKAEAERLDCSLPATFQFLVEKVESDTKSANKIKAAKEPGHFLYAQAARQ